MKLLLENWRRYLNEKDDKSGPLGKIAFSFDHSDDEISGKERDTEYEKWLAKQLENHFFSDKPLKTNVTDAIKNFIDKGLYPEAFQRYQKGDVYMGFRAPVRYFEERFGPLPKKPKWYRAPIDYMLNRAKKSFEDNPEAPSYIPRQKETTQMSLFPDLNKRAGSSWTTSSKVANRFRQALEGEVSIILVADSGDPSNYFIDAEPLYSYDFAMDYDHESEVVGVGDIKIKELTWFYEG